MRRFSPQIVHAHGLWLLFARSALNYKIRTGAPYVISAHGMLAPIALDIKPWRKRIARKLYQDRLLVNADCLVATSENEFDHIRNAGFRGPVAIIPLGIDDAPSVPFFSEEGEKRVIYIGRKVALKGLENLSMAWKAVAPGFPDWRLQIIGPDADGYEAYLRGFIGRNEVPRLDLLPAVFGESREAAYLGSQISVLPSTTENFALTVGESLVRGVPVIATRATPWAGLESHRCGLWIEGNCTALTAALQYMIALSAEERFAMGRRGRDWVLQEFQWSVAAERHHHLYRWLLGVERQPDFVVVD